MGNAKFVALQSGRNIGMCFGVDVGIHANADGGFLSQALSYFAEHFELGFTLDVKARDTRFERLTHLCASFTHA